MTRHHPSQDLLVEYAAGALSPSMALCVGVHLKYCPHCQEQVERLTSLGTALFCELEGVAPSEGLFDQILARIEEEDALERGPARENSAMRARKLLQSWLPGGWATVEWKPQWFKVYEYVLELSANGRSRLALQKIAAGGRAPIHGHHGREITVVLEGGFSDDQGVYEEGDFIIRDQDHQHRPRAMEHRDCICLTLLEAPVKLTGPFGQWIERLRRFFTPGLYPA